MLAGSPPSLLELRRRLLNSPRLLSIFSSIAVKLFALKSNFFIDTSPPNSLYMRREGEGEVCEVVGGGPWQSSDLVV